MSLWAEIKRRNVARVGAAYLVTAWLIVQAADVLVPALRLPDWMESAVVFVLILGFPLALIFAWAYELTPEGLKRESEVDRSASVTHFTGRKLDFLVIALLAVAVVYFAFDKFVFAPQNAAESVATVGADGVSDAAGTAEQYEPLSIAVLPFVNMSADPEQEFFSDGLSEELLNTLAQIKDLRVPARTSSFQFKGQNVDIAEIGRVLKVAHVLEGSVRKAGDRVRITAQLIKTDDGYHLWSEAYDRDLTDIFAIQREIATAITAELHGQLGIAAGSGPEPVVIDAGNPHAYEAYLKGRQLINRRGKANIQAGLRELERALRLDADYAPAHAQLAIATTLLMRSPATYGELTLAEVVQRAEPHIERAFELAPNLAEAHGARSLLSQQQNELQRAIEFGERAVAINPSYIDALNWLASAYEYAGRFADGVRLRKEIYARDPQSVIGRMNYVSTMAIIGEYDEAERVGTELARTQPWAGHTALESVEIGYRGRLARGIKHGLEAFAHEPEDVFTNMFLVSAFGWMGLQEEALRIHDNARYFAYLSSGQNAAASAESKRQLESDSENVNANFELAKALYRAGQVTEAGERYEYLLKRVAPTPVLLNPVTGVEPTLRLAHARRHEGNESGVRPLLEEATRYLEEINNSGRTYHYGSSASAMIAMLNKDHDGAIKALREAVEQGLRDPHTLEEPIFSMLQDEPAMRDVRERLEKILAEERASTIRLICQENPVPAAWQPLPATCQ